MDRRLAQERQGWERALLFLVTLPALVFGPVLGGAAAWVHSHGAGGHVHVVAAHAHADLGSLHEWHDAQHRHDHEGVPHDQEREPAPEGLLIDIPQVLAAAPRGPAPASATGVWVPPAMPALSGHSTVAERARPHDLGRSAWPPQRTQRSAVVELLRSSHAILI